MKVNITMRAILLALLCAQSPAAEPAKVAWEGRGQYRVLVEVEPGEPGDMVQFTLKGGAILCLARAVSEETATGGEWRSHTVPDAAVQGGDRLTVTVEAEGARQNSIALN